MLPSLNQPSVNEVMWLRIQRVLMKQRIPHALLLSSIVTDELSLFATHLMATLNCMTTPSDHPCGHCLSCRLMSEAMHPDVLKIEPEREEGVIRVDQIRLMQASIHQASQLGGYRFVLIHLADQLNLAAANALLKILEEPPLRCVFLLLANQPSLLPETIRSRCQHYSFDTLALETEKMALGQVIAKHSDDFLMIQATFEQVLNQEMTIDAFSAHWSQYPTKKMMELLYLLVANQIQWTITQAAGVSVCRLFQGFDQIIHFLSQLRRGYTFNTTLALERILSVMV